MKNKNSRLKSYPKVKNSKRPELQFKMKSKNKEDKINQLALMMIVKSRKKQKFQKEEKDLSTLKNTLTFNLKSFCFLIQAKYRVTEISFYKNS